MTEDVKAGQVWQHKNTGRRIDVVRPGPADDGGDTRGRWQVTGEGEDPAHGTSLISESILIDDFILVKEAP